MVTTRLQHAIATHYSNIPKLPTPVLDYVLEHYCFKMRQSTFLRVPRRTGKTVTLRQCLKKHQDHYPILMIHSSRLDTIRAGKQLPHVRHVYVAFQNISKSLERLRTELDKRETFVVMDEESFWMHHRYVEQIVTHENVLSLFSVGTDNSLGSSFDEESDRYVGDDERLSEPQRKVIHSNVKKLDIGFLVMMRPDLRALQTKVEKNPDTIFPLVVQKYKGSTNKYTVVVN